MVTPLATAVLLVLASIGLGAGGLAALGMWRDRAQLERTALAFALGFGVVGWLFFWVGVLDGFNPAVTWGLCGISLVGLSAYRIPAKPDTDHIRLSPVDWVLIALMAVAFAGDFFEGIAPPVDADSLAYHFELSRRFAERSELFFVPRALDGAIPLLIQMTYTAAYSMGGEKALTLWTLISGWGASLLLFALCRQWLGITWSLALVLLFQTLPAMIYGAGSGQVEARLALFVLVAVYGLIEFRRRGGWAPAVLVGLGAGLYAASKYTGLLFLAAAGLTLLLVAGRAWFLRGVVCGIAAIIIGGQWYAWNFIHTGDPVFPVLFNVLGLPDGPYWDSSYAADMKAYLALRHDQIAWWQRWLAYPAVATFFPPVAIEAGRVGLGPFFALIAPLSFLGFWRNRRRAWQSPLGPVALVTVVFYFLWLQFGGIPKVRHLLPVIPPLLLCLGVAASRFHEAWVRRPILLIFALSLALNFGAVAFFARPLAKFTLSSQTRDVFLKSSISGYGAVDWLNGRHDIGRVLVVNRHFRYYSQHPTHLAFPRFQKQVEARPGSVTPDQFWRQLREFKISHILTDRPTSASSGPHSINAAIQTLAKEGCLSLARTFQDERRTSRTLPGLRRNVQIYDVWKTDEKACPIKKTAPFK